MILKKSQDLKECTSPWGPGKVKTVNFLCGQRAPVPSPALGGMHTTICMFWLGLYHMSMVEYLDSRKYEENRSYAFLLFGMPMEVSQMETP